MGFPSGSFIINDTWWSYRHLKLSNALNQTENPILPTHSCLNPQIPRSCFLSYWRAGHLHPMNGWFHFHHTELRRGCQRLQTPPAGFSLASVLSFSSTTPPAMTIAFYLLHRRPPAGSLWGTVSFYTWAHWRVESQQPGPRHSVWAPQRWTLR